MTKSERNKKQRRYIASKWYTFYFCTKTRQTK
jgi:hypothetical protein